MITNVMLAHRISGRRPGSLSAGAASFKRMLGARPERYSLSPERVHPIAISGQIVHVSCRCIARCIRYETDLSFWIEMLIAEKAKRHASVTLPRTAFVATGVGNLPRLPCPRVARHTANHDRIPSPASIP